MFAYCGNNPVNYADPNGEDPVLIAAVGGAIAGTLISLFFYYNNAGEDATLGGALLAATAGALSGALGAAAGMVTGDVKMTYILSTAIVAGLFSHSTGGSFSVSAIFTYWGTYVGTYIDTGSYEGIKLVLANFLASLGTGYPTEMLTQSANQDIQEFRNATSRNQHSGRGGSLPSIGGFCRTQLQCIAFAE